MQIKKGRTWADIYNAKNIYLDKGVKLNCFYSITSKYILLGVWLCIIFNLWGVCIHSYLGGFHGTETLFDLWRYSGCCSFRH